MNHESINKVRSWMAEQSLSAFLVTEPRNRTYLSGWSEEESEAGLLLIGQHHLFLLTSPLYSEVASRDAAGWEVIVPPPPERDYTKIVVSLAQEHGWQKIGFEAEALSYATYAKYTKAGEGTFTLQPIEESYINSLRLVKQPHEIELLRRAVAITDATFAHICQWIQPGMTEKEVEWEISRKMVELGADGLSFPTIVASGPNGSMPHAVASQRRIQRGELITIDMGARYKGYHADMTRTICLGEPAEARMREIYDAVLLAMRTCEQKLYAGISGREADALARNVLAEAGLAAYFIHSTGHGVGLQIHEGPFLSQRAPEQIKLPAGCVVTVEPGVYIAGWTGTRVEDCVLIKEDGVEVLTQSPTELVISC
jgi:Xaa-Pro aminopeptidase